MIGLIFSFIAFLFSPIGFFLWGLGLVSFLLMPVIPAATGRFKKAANVHLWLALWAVQRASIVVTEHGELLFKRMEFDDLGVEQITFGSDTKDFEDPATALHHWMSYPFALADEVHGILFDPRHAAVGSRKHEYDQEGIGPIRASEHDYDTHGIDQWLPGVFDLPTKNELVDLSHIRHIIDGGERAEYPSRIEEIYKLTRRPFDSGNSSLRIFIPVAAFIAVLVALWQISSNMSGGGGGGPDEVVTGSVIALILTHYDLDDVRDWAAGVNWRRVGLYAAIIIPPVLVELLLLATGGLILFLLANIVFIMGFTFLPFFTLLARPSNSLSGGIARHIYLRLGLIGFTRPVLEWQPTGYRLRDADDLDISHDDVNWFGLAGSLIGFSYQPGPDSWGPDVLTTNEIDARSEVDIATGGGRTDLPTGWVRAPGLKRDVYGAYVPKESKLQDDRLYLDSHIALKRMTDAAVGEKSLRKLLWAKEEYGDGSFGLSDKALLWATMGSIGLGSVLGVFLFFL